MQLQARERVFELTALLTVVSLALVFGAVLGAVPDGLLPEIDPLLAVIPHLNVVVSLAAIGTILAGVRAIRNGRIERHRTLMLASFGLFSGFLVMYLYRVAIVGAATFPGPETVYLYVYLPVLAIHMILAIICIPFVFYALLLGATRSIEEIYETRHRTIGQVAASLWLLSFSLGILVYVLLYVIY